MNREKAYKLLTSGEPGIKEWNHRRQKGEKIPVLKHSWWLSGANLRNANLSGVDFGCIFDTPYLGRGSGSIKTSNFKEADLSKANLSNANFHKANLCKAKLRSADLSNALLRDAKLDGAKLHGARLHNTELTGANLSTANLSKANLSKANLSKANLSNANLSKANLSEVNLSRANLSKANLSNAKLSGVNLRSTKLRGANLQNAELSKANFHGVDLTDVNLCGADLSGANLHKAYINNTNLRSAKLCNANLVETIIIDTEINNANLNNTNLNYARFIRSDLSDSTVEKAIVQNVDIQELIGLPQPPEELWFDIDGEEKLNGDKARYFFVRPVDVKVIMDKILPDATLVAYQTYYAVGRAQALWPEDIIYMGATPDDQQTILSFQATRSQDIIDNLSILLAPFKSVEFIDWEKTLKNYSVKQAKLLINALVERPKFRNLIVKKMQQYQGFSDGRPVFIITGNESINVVFNSEAENILIPGANLGVNLLLLKTGDMNIMDKKININTGEIHDSQIGSIGLARDVNVFNQTIDNSSNMDDELKKTLKEARQKIEELELSRDNKNDLIDDFVKFSDEIQQPEPNRSRIKRFYGRINELAPPIASILSMAASIAALLS
jgi:uncharacterized protein YjbI with pentapeptide repeats